MEFARIKLAGKSPEELKSITDQINEIAKRYEVSVRGPIPLPTKKLKIQTLKTPCGDGTGHGNATWDRFEMRVHKRLIDLGLDERALRLVMRVPIPEGLNIEIEMVDA